MFYEIIFETGTVSVAYYESDDEANSAIQDHNERAQRGAPGGPAGHFAERVKKVLVYDKHPGDWVMADKELTVKGSSDEMIQQIREAAHPFTLREHPHDSLHKMKEKRELKGWQ